ncbi:MAG: GSCFA domain-containing protein [bacterium]|nr:GSCFA domain-containing protein [bacterium]
MGSCFAQNMGNLLGKHYFNLMLNPFGIVFNPISLAQQLQLLIEPSKFNEHTTLFSHQERVHSWLHHGSFSRTNKAQFMQEITSNLLAAQQQLKEASTLIITWGSANVYKLKETQMVVSNCHKVPANQFQKYQLSIGEIAETYKQVLKELNAFNPHLQIIWSVSPVKYVRDGLHENNLSKATLLLALEEVMKLYPNSYYFPAFEMQQDELRDYRFYASDMAHPSEQAIQYIWEQFVAHCIAPNDQQLLAQVYEFNRAMEHRPLHADTAEFQQFRASTLEKIKQFRKSHSHINLDRTEMFFS